MGSIGRGNYEQIRISLQDAVVKCSERCLYQSAKWAAELAASLPTSISSNPSFENDPDSDMGDAEIPFAIPPTFSCNADPEEARLEAREYSKYILAKSFFDCREYDRCASVFLPQDAGRDRKRSSPLNSRTPTKAGKGKARDIGASQSRVSFASNDDLPVISQKSLFLSLYAKYMSGEKRKDEASEMILGPTDGGSTVNRELVGLTRILEAWFSDRAARGLEGSNQGWLEYLYGIVLAKGKSEHDAKRWLLRSVHLCPFNWGAWLELNDLLNDVEELQELVPQLSQNLMTLIFHLFASQELYQSNDNAHHILSELERVFPGSLFLKTQRALLFYHAKDFEEAESIFSSIIQADPHRIDSLDHYSNMLYVMENRPKLAYLAQIATATDKFRPETCCVIGNYYGLKSEHEKAVIYFRRALTLDRSCLSAWILMGHEYLEMKNTHAAIESYRRAVDINRKDYRAWHGLGQTYEMLEMPLYSLFYFQRAASLRPYDPKLWIVTGQCYDKIDRPLQAIKAYKRALMVGSYYDQNASSVSASATTSFTSNQGAATGGRGANALNSQGSEGSVLDPEILFAIASLYEKLDNIDEAAAYMEMTIAQEEGTSLAPPHPRKPKPKMSQAHHRNRRRHDVSTTDHEDGGQATTSIESDNDDNATLSEDDEDNEDYDDINDIDGELTRGPGTGVTSTTSKARIWLARWSFAQGDMRRAMELANELCHDGIEVEEAKALIRDLRARMEADQMHR